MLQVVEFYKDRNSKTYFDIFSTNQTEQSANAENIG